MHNNIVGYSIQFNLTNVNSVLKGYTHRCPVTDILITVSDKYPHMCPATVHL